MAGALSSLRARFSRRRHTVLLAAIILLFAVRPAIGDSAASAIVFSLVMLALLLMALYTIQIDELQGERHVLVAQRRRTAIIGWALAIPAIADRLVTFVAPSPLLYLLGAIAWFLFFAFVTFTELRSVLRQKSVTGETISMSISVYLLLGLTWALLYIVMYEIDPGAFNLGASPPGSSTLGPHGPEAFPVFVYFSLTTLATIGFGDVVPVALQARYAAVAEGITGQFYLAILVARLVAMQMSRSGGGSGGEP